MVSKNPYYKEFCDKDKYINVQMETEDKSNEHNL